MCIFGQISKWHLKTKRKERKTLKRFAYITLSMLLDLQYLKGFGYGTNILCGNVL